MNEWAQIINMVGFPIVSFLIAAYFIKYTYDKADAQQTEAMKSVHELAIAVNHNTEVLTQLVNEIKENSEV